MAKKQTAGRNDLGTFAPKFAELNEDVLTAVTDWLDKIEILDEN